VLGAKRGIVRNVSVKTQEGFNIGLITCMPQMNATKGYFNKFNLLNSKKERKNCTGTRDLMYMLPSSYC
jgi:regulation of enolase protein 1 (concanavalin A-like superfamily)